VAALAALAVWGASPYARYLDHGDLDHGHHPGSIAGQAAALGLYETGWVLMIVAMMLPTATALLAAVGRLGEDPAAGRRLRLRAAGGFVATWAVVGYMFRVADVGVHAAVGSTGWVAARPHLLAAATLTVAGAFQFSALKHRCLTACRSPQSFVYRFWHGGSAGRDATRVGAAYGVSCVGCCWALMLIVFGMGMSSLAWMLGLGTVMAAERHTRRGPTVGRVAGVALVVAGVVVAATGRPTPA
jgi:predicted metal-binding membrane protein